MPGITKKMLLLTIVLCLHLYSVQCKDVQSRYQRDAEISSHGDQPRATTTYHWGHWSSYTNCSGSCNTGDDVVMGSHCRHRTCLHQHPNSSHAVTITHCDLHLHGSLQTVCTNRSCYIICPVDGGWSSWQKWGTCSVTGSGVQVRQRSCTNPKPLFEGKDCAGPSTQTMACALNIWSTWSTWSDCTVTCSDGIRFRARHCINGTSCIGNIVEQVVCTKPRCLHLIDGSWGDWSAWGKCSQTCGNAVNVRVRQCDSPAPQDGGKNCDGSADGFKFCKIADCPIDGGWSNYTEKPCSVSCGVGVVVSVRECTNPAPAYGGNTCQGSPTLFGSCTLPECVIDGGWAEWSDYSACRVICGYGNQRRERNCTSPEPRNGGEPCVGNTIDKTECYNGICPPDIKTCDKVRVKSAAAHGTIVMFDGQSVCDDKIHAKPESLIEALCNTTGGSSEWKLGLKISDGCDLIPMYSPIGYENMATKERKYGIMMSCNQNAILVATQSCNSGVHFSNIDLSPNGTDYHMLLW